MEQTFSFFLLLFIYTYSWLFSRIKALFYLWPIKLLLVCISLALDLSRIFTEIEFRILLLQCIHIKTLLKVYYLLRILLSLNSEAPSVLPNNNSIINRKPENISYQCDILQLCVTYLCCCVYEAHIWQTIREKIICLHADIAISLS